MLETLQYTSILLEFLIVIMSLIIAIVKKKSVGYFFALTFAIYVFYDLSKLIKLNISSDILYIMFFIATLSALYAVYAVYKSK